MRAAGVTARRGYQRRAALLLGIDDLPPGVIGIEGGHLRGDAGRAFAKILFVDVAFVVDDERHDAGIAVFGRIGNGRKAADHVALDDVINGAARRSGALAQQDFVVIAVVRFAGARAIAALRCLGDRLTQRARWFVAARRPIEPVFLAGRADDPLRIDRLATLALVHVGIILLRVPVREPRLHGRELVAADANIENPLAVALHHRNRERPVVWPHDQYRRLAGF